MRLTDVSSKFTVTDLCAILEACGKSHVAELKWGDLFVKFGPQSPVSQVVEHRTPVVLPLESEDLTPEPRPAKEIAETQTTIARESLELDEIHLKEDQLALLAIEDPQAYEQMVADGELDEDGFSDIEDGA